MIFWLPSFDVFATNVEKVTPLSYDINISTFDVLTGELFVLATSQVIVSLSPRLQIIPSEFWEEMINGPEESSTETTISSIVF